MSAPGPGKGVSAPGLGWGGVLVSAPGPWGCLLLVRGGGDLRGIWSRPTAKGEVEGDLVQAHSQGGI